MLTNLGRKRERLRVGLEQERVDARAALEVLREL